ncbi:MAG: hypothetical protein Q3971_05875 [Moraxella sp.]|nr:hypothetical protein [Moraxella sp.]
MQTVTLQLDDVYYQKLMSQVGKENLAEFFQKVSKPYFLLNKTMDVPNNRPYRLGALSHIKVPDNFDDIEITDFDV